jgi:hypothetical protein
VGGSDGTLDGGDRNHQKEKLRRAYDRERNAGCVRAARDQSLVGVGAMRPVAAS